MSFSFNFDNDDIEQDEEDQHANTAYSNLSDAAASSEVPAVPPQKHSVEDLLATIPSNLSFNVVEIEAPRGKKLLVPRRELFDVRVQLMAEDENLSASSGLDDSDIRTNVYEGGFKSWECSFDLAKLVLDRGPRKDLDDMCRVNAVVELGCGTAIPSLVLFQHAITERLEMFFTLTDYNLSVLKHVTLPNLFLTYISTLPATGAPFSAESPNPLTHAAAGAVGDIEITQELKRSFLDALRSSNIELSFVSGTWLPTEPFLSLLPAAPDMNTFVLASETIYSTAALQAFAAALVGILKRVRLGKAFVAAKKVYFGVGGSIDAFKRECAELGAVVAEVENSGVDLGQEGVRRSLVEVQML